MKNAMPKSIRLAAAAALCFATAALANSNAQLKDAAGMGGAYSSPYPAKADGVPVALLSEELMTAASFAIKPPTPVPEAPSAAILGLDLLVVAGLIVVGRRVMVRSRTQRA